MSQRPAVAGSAIADPGSFRPDHDGLRASDPLAFPGYSEMLAAASRRASADESVVAGPATIAGHEVELALFDFSFLGGSMGEVAGERLARALERAADRAVAFVLRTTTGGARMQEGMHALVQMAKVTVARARLRQAHVPFLCILGNPTTGGVLASLASQADVIAAEAGATIGFAGPRLVQNFTGRPLQEGSHTAARAYRHGLVDAQVPPDGARSFVVDVLDVLRPDEPETIHFDEVIHDDLDPWDAVAAARAADRPTPAALLEDVTDSMVVVRGDREGTDDPALLCGIARVAGRRAVVIAMDRAHAPGPAAYRKARRCIRLAESLALPVVTLIDTRGADPSEGPEAGGIAWEIAATFDAMLTADAPSLAIVTGQGGSGGALALAVADRLSIYRDAVFSVIAPESAAEILWRDSGRAGEAARALQPTASSLRDAGIADDVVAAPLDAISLRAAVASGIDTLRGVTHKARQERWRRHA